MIIYNGLVPMVSYSVEGGSPHLQALCQTLAFTENEMNLTKELQKLRLGIVANEQTLDKIRTSQALGLGPISTPSYAPCYTPSESALKNALIPGLAQEATPAMAFQLINLWEKFQTELQAEQAKAAAPAPGAPPAKQNAPAVMPPPGAAVPQPKAPPAGLAAAPVASRVMVPLQTVLQQPPLPLDQVAFEQRVRQNQEQLRQQIRQTQRIMQRMLARR
jgi:hypothetical protein